MKQRNPMYLIQNLWYCLLIFKTNRRTKWTNCTAWNGTAAGCASRRAWSRAYRRWSTATSNNMMLFNGYSLFMAVAALFANENHAMFSLNAQICDNISIITFVLLLFVHSFICFISKCNLYINDSIKPKAKRAKQHNITGTLCGTIFVGFCGAQFLMMKNICNFPHLHWRNVLACIKCWSWMFLTKNMSLYVSDFYVLIRSQRSDSQSFASLNSDTCKQRCRTWNVISSNKLRISNGQQDEIAWSCRMNKQ